MRRLSRAPAHADPAVSAFRANVSRDWRDVLVKAGEMLDFLDTPRNDVVLTDLGRGALALDANRRKALLNQQVRKLSTFQFLIQLLATTTERRLPKHTVLDELKRRLATHAPEPLFDTIVAWARHAELFGYERKVRCSIWTHPNRASGNLDERASLTEDRH